MPAVKPEILVWARETAGLSREDAVAKVGIRAARGMAGVDRLAALERGDEAPTRPTLVKMARCYRRPLLAFYLSAPPRRDDRRPDLRTLPGARAPEEDALLDALVRSLQSRQRMVRAALEAEDEAAPLPFVGSLLQDADGRTGMDIEALRRALRRNADAVRMARRAQAALTGVLGGDLAAAEYHAQPSPDQAFRLLRSRAEAAAVFVLLEGDLGSHHSTVDVEVFRGLAIADDVAPFIVINANDSRAARSFTLLHELTHLLLGQSGFGGVGAGDEIETFCNNVAAEWLLPARMLDEIETDEWRDSVEQQRGIEAFARARNLSRTLVAYRLLRAHRIDRPTFERLGAGFRAQWRQHRDLRRASRRGSEGGPSFYRVRRHRVGPGLLRLTRRMVASGALSTTRAARVLGVRPARVGEVLRAATA